jgi:hypothetical protein
MRIDLVLSTLVGERVADDAAAATKLGKGMLPVY